MKNFFFVLLLFICTPLVNRLQAQRVCGSMGNLERQLQADPEMQIRMERIEEFTQSYLASHPDEASRAIVTIPVVFHIIHNGDALGSGENISDTYINAQLDQLNKDFAKLNSDASQVPSAFASLHVDTEIRFCLAKRKPDGTATTGIDRLNKGQTSWTISQIEGTLKPATVWNSSKYLNIWTVVFGGSDAGTLGYAQFPGGSASADGVVLLYSSLGSTATPNSAGGVYGKGRTATHEVGHWLNLRHIWGDANCGSDLVSDTPTQQTSNYGCPSFPHTTCSNGSNGDMFMNYMDYTDDACMYMFSNGQKGRMQALFASGGARVSLATSDGCSAPSSGGGGTTCATPSGLGASAITSSSATISWVAVSGATSYNVQYKLSSASTWTTITSTSTSISISGLSASSTYNYQVQAVCSVTGAYSSVSSFTTSSATLSCTNYESNGSNTSATAVSANSTTESFIGSSTDIDWFKFTTTTSAPKVKVTLTSLPYDYDLKLYRGSTLLGISQNGGTTSEQLIYNTSSAYTYYVRVYGYNGVYSCSDSYLMGVQTQASNFRLEDIALESLGAEDLAILHIMPNPAYDWVDIHYLAGESGEVKISLFDLAGKQVYSQKTTANAGENDFTMDLNTLSGGYYIVLIDNGLTVQQTKLAIAK